MPARTLMIQGTGSSVGKSLIVAALCRIFRDQGLRVAPFKSQNMALNSFVTPDGGEIGRAQAVQAEAAGIEPSVEMNPILLKPEPGMRSQVVLLGKPVASLEWSEYRARIPHYSEIVRDSLGSLCAKFDLVLIEGAGSPAEINLKAREIVNMHVAAIADAPVILVGDIDRGGVFAQLVGTMELLEPGERARVAAFLINKFRGRAELLKPGLDFLVQRYAIPVLGVVPYLERLRIAEEDSVGLERRRAVKRSSPAQLDIAIVRLPSISNYDDFLPLEHEPTVAVRWAERPADLHGADLVVLPGSKSTVADLAWMRRDAIARAVADHARHGGLVLGICAGCQMLGEKIEDPERVESGEFETAGLGLLPLRTRFEPTKVTARVIAHPKIRSFLAPEPDVIGQITGYEIHMGRTVLTRSDSSPLFAIISRNGAPCDASDGAVSADGRVLGTMIHGIFDNQSLTRSFLGELRKRRAIALPPGPPPEGDAVRSREGEYVRLAAAVKEAIDFPRLLRIVGL